MTSVSCDFDRHMLFRTTGDGYEFWGRTTFHIRPQMLENAYKPCGIAAIPHNRSEHDTELCNYTPALTLLQCLLRPTPALSLSPLSLRIHRE